MNDTELDVLIQEVLDGTATPEQRARFDAHFASTPTDAARRRELEHVFERLRALPSADAPPGLRQSVLERIESAGQRERVSWLGPAGGTTPLRGTLRIALPFALGFAAGAIAFVGWSAGPGRGPGGNAVGTMMPDAGSVERIEAGGLKVAVRGERHGDRQVLRFMAESSGTSDEIVIAFDAAATRIASLRQTDARQGTIEAGPGRVRLVPERDAGWVVELVHGDAGARVDLLVRSGDVTAQRTLPTDFGEDR